MNKKDEGMMVLVETKNVVEVWKENEGPNENGVYALLWMVAVQTQ